MNDRDAQAREVNAAMNEAVYAFENAARLFDARGAAMVSMSGRRAAHGAARAVRIAEMLAALDDLVATVRPKVEETQRLDAQLTAADAEFERRAQEAADAERDAAAVEARVQAVLAAEEAQRRANDEERVRKQLAAAGGKR